MSTSSGKPQNPIGLLVDGLGLGGAEWDKTLAHIIAANYATVTIMDSFGFCIAVKNALPDCVVIFRSSAFEPQPGTGAVASLMRFLNGIKSQDKRIVIMTSCETGAIYNDTPNESPTKYVDMWCDFIERADAMGWKLCVGNVASGTVKSGQGQEENHWFKYGARLLETLARFPGHFLGVHEYTSFFAWIVSNVGSWGNPQNPPTYIDWSMNQWHLGRNAQGIMKAARLLKIDALLSRRFMVITESLFDEMEPNVLAQYPDYKTRGWKQLRPFWAKIYPARHVEATLAFMEQWAWEHVYAPLKFVLGMNVFIYYSHNPQWDEFRVDDAPIYLDAMEKYPEYVPTQPPPVDTPPTPTEPPAQPPPQGHLVSTAQWAELQTRTLVVKAEIDAILAILKTP